MSTANAATAMSGTPKLPPVLGRLLSGTFWLALRVPLQVVFSLWTTRLILQAIGPFENGAYIWAWGWGFFQFLFEFGASSALQRQISDAWTRGDREGVNRAIASGLTSTRRSNPASSRLSRCGMGLAARDTRGQFIPTCREVALAPGAYRSVLRFLGGGISVLQAARRYDFVPRYELAIVIFRFLVLWVGLAAGVDFFWVWLPRQPYRWAWASGRPYG